MLWCVPVFIYSFICIFLFLFGERSIWLAAISHCQYIIEILTDQNLLDVENKLSGRYKVLGCFLYKSVKIPNNVWCDHSICMHLQKQICKCCQIPLLCKSFFQDNSQSYTNSICYQYTIEQNMTLRIRIFETVPFPDNIYISVIWVHISSPRYYSWTIYIFFDHIKYCHSANF